MGAGIVQLYLTARGYGFILPDAGGESVFFHGSVFEPGAGPPPIAGERVTYQTASQVAGVKAELVRRVEEPRRLTGTVKNYNPLRGFGFVQTDSAADPRYYLHKSELLSRTDPVRGSRVDFYAAPKPVRGESPRACYVTVIS